MSRATKAQFRAAHRQADRFEPRAARAFVLAVQRARTRIPLGRLAALISARDATSAADLLSGPAVEDALEPSAAILADAFVRGAKVAADELPRPR
jgi:hypothetical protein